MKSLILFSTFLLIVSANATNSCPDFDKQIFPGDTDFVEAYSLPDWHACGHLCETNEECRYWSFGPADIVKTACFLLTQESMLHDSRGWVSGAKDCQ